MRRARILAIGAVVCLSLAGLASADQHPGATYKGKTALDGNVWLVVSSDGSAVTEFVASFYNGCGSGITWLGGWHPIDRVRQTFSIYVPDDYALIKGSFTTDTMAEGTLHLAGSCEPDTTWRAEVTGEAVPQPPGGPPVRCRVPRVIGMALPRARRAIGTSHCALGSVRYKRSSRPRGHVLAQAPKE